MKNIALVGLLAFYNTRFSIGIISTEKDREKAYKLRADVFGKILKYPEVNAQRDYDKYDDFAVVFGVFENDELISTCRLVLSNDKFMLEEDFAAALKGEPVLKSPLHAEISRMCVNPLESNSRKSICAEFLLYRFMYRWSRSIGIRYWYFCVRPNYYKKLHKFFGFDKYTDDFYFNDDSRATSTVIGDLQNAAFILRNNGVLLQRYFVGVKYKLGTFPSPVPTSEYFLKGV